MLNPYPGPTGATFDDALAALRRDEHSAYADLWQSQAKHTHGCLVQGLRKISRFEHLHREDLEDLLAHTFSFKVAELRHNTLVGVDARRFIEFEMIRVADDFLLESTDSILSPDSRMRKKHPTLNRDRKPINFRESTDRNFARQRLPNTTTRVQVWCDKHEHPEGSMYHDSENLLGWLDNPTAEETLLSDEKRRHQQRCREIFYEVLPAMAAEAKTEDEIYITRCLMNGVSPALIIKHYGNGLSYKAMGDILHRLDLKVAATRYREMLQQGVLAAA
jgi:hypothetical protein